jgi:hypothetical protein
LLLEEIAFCFSFENRTAQWTSICPMYGINRLARFFENKRNLRVAAWMDSFPDLIRLSLACAFVIRRVVCVLRFITLFFALSELIHDVSSSGVEEIDQRWREEESWRSTISEENYHSDRLLIKGMFGLK